MKVNFRRLAKYGATSAIALGVSELALVIVYANGIAGAALASLIANLTGTVPSYLLSRYWIWSDASRVRAGRQVALYWLTSLISMAVTSGAMEIVADLSPKGKRAHVIVVGVGFVFVSAFLWVAKYAVYHTVIFPDADRTTRGSDEAPVTVSDPVDDPVRVLESSSPH